MNVYDDYELLLWAMRAGLTYDEVRHAVRGGLAAGDLPRQDRPRDRSPTPGMHASGLQIPARPLPGRLR